MTAPPPTGFATVPLGGQVPEKLGDAASKSWVRQIAAKVNSLLQGKANASLAITLAESAASTAVVDARIAATSMLLLQPLTAHAAALLYASPYVLITSQQSGQVVFAHSSVANSDLNFNLLIIG